jgi:hypothetical protein
LSENLILVIIITQAILQGMAFYFGFSLARPEKEQTAKPTILQKVYQAKEVKEEKPERKPEDESDCNEFYQ